MASLQPILNLAIHSPLARSWHLTPGRTLAPARRVDSPAQVHVAVAVVLLVVQPPQAEIVIGSLPGRELVRKQPLYSRALQSLSTWINLAHIANLSHSTTFLIDPVIRPRYR